MKLDILQRLTIVGLMPEKSNYAEMLAVTALAQKLALTGDELLKWNVKTLDNGKVMWNASSDTSTDIELSEGDCKLIVKYLRKLDETNSLTIPHMKIWDIFVNAAV